MALADTAFQPSPGASTGCEGVGQRPFRTPRGVSTLTRCEHRVRASRPRGIDVSKWVSTLTRCEHRVRGGTMTTTHRRYTFQPSPGASTGCEPSPLPSCARTGPCFNPHPVRAPGASVLQADEVLIAEVSTLTRCEHRVRGSAPCPGRSPAASFNPHPVRAPGARAPRAFGGARENGIARAASAGYRVDRSLLIARNGCVDHDSLRSAR